ncbi:MAG: Gfo/Idh/MocA family oxidoreductase [Hyphomicrobium sp.]|nr:Gfo/Idh/MocA family oxidoreductase [Hyphomicrobium sp.]
MASQEMAPVEPMRLAIVGCGAITEAGHAPGVIASRYGRLTTLVDIDIERARALGKKFGISDVRDNTRGLAESVDGAIGAVPHHVHEAVATDILGQGLHLLMEKPLGCSVAECERIVSASRRSGTTLATAMLRRFVAANRMVRRIIEDQMLGTVESFSFDEGQLFSWPIKTPFLLQPNYPGRGVLIGNGSHIFDLVRWLFGDVADIAVSADSDNGGESDATIDLKMTSGARGAIRLSRIRALDSGIRIRFSRGEVHVPPFGDDVKLMGLDGRPIAVAKPEAEFDVSTNSAQMRDLMALQVDNFVVAARLGRRPEVDGADATDTIRLVERAAAKVRVTRMPWSTRGVHLPAA